ncbi:nucleoside/nucleotide kinase family protein [Candidatus Njordibacter sp. Uisw_039]|uniref:nucleoside/nucleotide kinase family protein n=1 Tax=Candidatus Njordibacter sp. Uisw_039 TaxID=3230972 RepID=UPI003D5C73F6
MIHSDHQFPVIKKGELSEVFLAELAAMILERTTSDGRLVIAIVGAPGCGKSTATDALEVLLAQNKEIKVQVVPMDGFHYDNAILEQLGMTQRKGVPETFDVGGLDAALKRLTDKNQTESIAVPVFDRNRDISLACARLIDKKMTVLLIEGNYLLLKDGPWSHLKKYFDLSVMIPCDEVILRARLISRWKNLNYNNNNSTIKVEQNDMPNVKLIVQESCSADVNLKWNKS